MYTINNNTPYHTYTQRKTEAGGDSEAETEKEYVLPLAERECPDLSLAQVSKEELSTAEKRDITLD